MDEVRFEDIETYGAERWLGELAERLQKKDYRPEAVKRVWIPKPNGNRSNMPTGQSARRGTSGRRTHKSSGNL